MISCTVRAQLFHFRLYKKIAAPLKTEIRKVTWKEPKTHQQYSETVSGVKLPDAVAGAGVAADVAADAAVAADVDAVAAAAVNEN